MKTLKISLLLSAFALLFAGCSVWNNFTTYFNLYYNTTLLFEDAELAINEQRKDYFQLTEPSIPNNANQSLGKVIEKCSKLLQFNFESSFVDEALMMTGKAFYYQKLYPRALRKFRELLVKVPDSDLVPEAELWIARTEIQLRNYSPALELLNVIKAKAAKDEDTFLQSLAYIEEIKYYHRLERYTEAIKLTNELIAIADDDEILYQSIYELGELNSKMNNYKAASNAYLKVLDYTLSYEYEFNTKLKYAKMQRMLNESDKAIEVLENLRKEEKNSTYYDLIALELGMVYKEQGKYDEAYERFKYIDSAFSNSVNAGIARYEMGEMYEVDVFNYDSAFVYYQKALSSISNIEYAPKIKSKAQLFTTYRTFSGNQTNFLKQLEYLTDSTAFEKDSIAFIEYAERQVSQTPTTQGDEELSANPRGENKQASLQSFQQEVKTAPQRPTVSLDSLSALIAKNSFELGNLFFNDFFVYDSAYYYLRLVVDNYPKSNSYPEALYTLGTYYYTTKDSAKADSIFNVFYDNYKHLRLVNAVAVQLKKPIINFDYDPVSETYALAETKMKNQDYSGSMNSFYAIFIKHPKSSFAPKSLYTHGWILEEKLLMLDSAASVYDTLVTNYPSSVYATKVSPKLTFYKNEKARIEKERQDSLQKINDDLRAKVIADSLSNITNLKIQDEPKEETKPEEEIIPDENSEKKFESEEEAEPPKEQSESNISWLNEKHLFLKTNFAARFTQIGEECLDTLLIRV